jgi:hypothetical protein
MPCHCGPTYSNQVSDSCASDFGAPASDSSRFVVADQNRLIQSQSSPVLRPGDCFCLQTKGLCGYPNQVAYLTVREGPLCRPSQLYVFISSDECICELSRCDLLKGVDAGTYEKGVWSNAEGNFVEEGECCPVDGVFTICGESYDVILRASRGRLTCVRVTKIRTSVDDKCCTNRSLCNWYASRLPSHNECCEAIREDCGCCEPCSCVDGDVDDCDCDETTD